MKLFEKCVRHLLWRLEKTGVFNQMSDEKYLKLMFRLKMGRKLNLDNPQTFNEKIQWLKLYDRRSEYTRMVDKYEAKKYVDEILGEEYIIPTLGVWDRFEDIDFDALPDQFVLKCTHDSGGLVIVRDKAQLDKKSAREKIERSLKRNYFLQGREWPYKNVKPRIIAEQYMDSGATRNSSIRGLVDYKFYCFGGKVKCLYVSKGLEDHSTARISFLLPDWTFAPFQRTDYKHFEELPEKPVNYIRMIDAAEKLSQGRCFLRVDLYEIQGKIYFSEMTFSPCGGMMKFNPEEWDRKMGDWLHLENCQKSENGV